MAGLTTEATVLHATRMRAVTTTSSAITIHVRGLRIRLRTTPSSRRPSEIGTLPVKRPSLYWGAVTTIRRSRDDERSDILAIVNAAAEAYRGVIPADRWHEPYMLASELDLEIAAGVEFWVYESEGVLAGTMGIQPVRDVDLIRHAYVHPGSQRRGVGGALLVHLRALSTRRMLVGTWAEADWAISFYHLHGFELVPAERTTSLLKTYWTVPDRQIETSVVLANPPIEYDATIR